MPMVNMVSNVFDTNISSIKEMFAQKGYAFPERPLLKDGQLDALCRSFDKIYSEGMNPDMPHVYMPELFDFLADEHVLSIVADIIGDDILLWASHFICKEPKTGVKTPWHTDADYWQSKIKNLPEVKLCTIWLALDDVDLQNGCMGVIPGSHKLNSEAFEYVDAGSNSLFEQEIRNVDESNVVWFELKKGRCSLHDPRIIHGAKPNSSTRRRCGYTMRYISGNVQMLDTSHPLYLLKGESQHLEGSGNLRSRPSILSAAQ